MKKKYLISGASGYLGRNLKSKLDPEEYDSLGRNKSNTIIHDLNQSTSELKLNSSYEYIIIASGHAHVMKRTENEDSTHLQVNYHGTIKIIEALKLEELKGIVFISTIAVYGSRSFQPFRESDNLIGKTSYARSKILAEQFLSEWSRKNNIPVLILRLPLIAGFDPPGNLGQMINAIKIGRYFSLKNGESRRSMVLVDDLVIFIINNLGKKGIYNLTDGHHPSYRELELLISNQLNVPSPKNVPFFLVLLISRLGDIFSFIPINSNKLSKLTQDLIMDDSLARKELEWNPLRVIENYKVAKK